MPYPDLEGSASELLDVGAVVHEGKDGWEPYSC